MSTATVAQNPASHRQICPRLPASWGVGLLLGILILSPLLTARSQVVDPQSSHSTLAQDSQLTPNAVATSIELPAELTDDALPPWEFRRYRVIVDLSLPRRDESPTLATDFRERLAQTLTRHVGHLWQVDWQVSPVVDSEDVTQYQVKVTRQAGRWQAEVAASEPFWEDHSASQLASVVDERELDSTILALMWNLFRPRAIWEKLSDDDFRLRVQAAALAETSTDFPLLKSVEYFLPSYAYRHRDGRLKQLVHAPWTFLELREQTAGRGTAHVLSGLRRPLATRPRGKVELLAIAARSRWPQTTVELRTQSQPPRLMVAHEVRLRAADEGANHDVDDASRVLISDRNGEINIPQNSVSRSPSISPLQWLTVFSGDQRLADVPLLMGATSRVSLTLPDDQLRLRVEGQLKLLQSDLISDVAERAALMLTCRAAARRSAWPEVQATLQRLQNMRTVEQYRERLTGIRVPAVAAATQSKDLLTERRVQRMCDDMQKLLVQYLGEDKLRLLREEMAELQAAAASNP